MADAPAQQQRPRDRSASEVAPLTEWQARHLSDRDREAREVYMRGRVRDAAFLHFLIYGTED